MKRYKNTEHYKKIKQAEAELDKRIKETSSQFLKQRNQKIKQQLAYLWHMSTMLCQCLFFLLLPLALITLGLTSFLLLLLTLIIFGFTFFPLYRKIYFVVFSPLITRFGIPSSLSLPWLRWFSDNFNFTREGRSRWIIHISGQSFFCLLLLLLISFEFTFFLVYKIYPTVFSPLITRLGIPSWLSFPLLIAAFYGSVINLPFFILTAPLSERRINFELLPLWLLKCWCLPSYKTRYQSYGYISINVSGGLIPIILALYQIHRTQPLEILIVTAIVGLMSYFLVTVIPGRAIVTRESRFWLIATVAALSAMAFVAPGVNRTDVSVAFAGAVLGITIGGDLLHLKDVVRSENAVIPLSIGGAGLNDGIAQCGLYALIIAEWLPAAIAWLSTYSR